MSEENNLHDKSTAEMETKENFNAILSAISDMHQDFLTRFDGLETRFDGLETRFDKLEKKVEKAANDQADLRKFVDVQFEAIRQGLVKNYAYFERLEGQVAENRAVIFSTKAITTELREEIFLLNRKLKHTI